MDPTTAGRHQRPIALITGVTGQDGSYLAEFLLAEGYEVRGLVRRSSRPLPPYLDSRIRLVHGDMTDSSSLGEAVIGVDEVYNLAAQSDVGASFSTAEATADVDAMGVLRLLEALRRRNPTARLYQAGTSEMFGSSPAPQNELTPFHPRSPYAVAKAFAHHAVVHYREAYGLHASNGILFNHESPRRGEQFVTRKVTKAAVEIANGRTEPLCLGNLSTMRDWGYAPEYVRAMWLMLQQEQPDDYVVATGTSYSVLDLCRAAFALVGLDWRDHVEFDPAQVRPTDVPHLRGDARKALSILGWSADTALPELLPIMLLAETGCPPLKF